MTTLRVRPTRRRTDRAAADATTPGAGPAHPARPALRRSGEDLVAEWAPVFAAVGEGALRRELIAFACTAVSVSYNTCLFQVLLTLLQIEFAVLVHKDTGVRDKGMQFEASWAKPAYEDPLKHLAQLDDEAHAEDPSNPDGVVILLQRHLLRRAM